MNITFHFRNSIVLWALLAGFSLQAEINQVTKNNDMMNNDALLLLKAEMDNAKSLLVQIRNNQNPALSKKAIDSMNTVIKELLYIIAAIALGASGVAVAAGVHYGPKEIGEMIEIYSDPAARGINIRSPEADELRGRLILVLPALAISMITSYLLLKFIGERLLVSTEDASINIQESLTLIDQTINKLTNQISKMESLSKNKGDASFV